MSEFLKLLISAFLGICAGLLVQWWKSHRDELRVLCDEFCKNVVEAADLGSNYWQTSSSNEGNKLKEAQLLGLQVRLDGYRVLVTRHFDENTHSAIHKASADFFDALTGGNFKSAKRLPDFERVLLAQTKASEVILAIRQSFQETMGFKSTCRRQGILSKKICVSAAAYCWNGIRRYK